MEIQVILCYGDTLDLPLNLFFEYWCNVDEQ
jgi:hypothetical protein